jgi:putative ABC transport system permease protein
MAMTDLQIVTRSLAVRAVSTGLTALSVAVAVGLVLVLLTTRDASREAFQRGTGNMHILASGDANQMGSVLNSVFYTSIPQRVVPFETWQRVRTHPLVEWALGTVQGDNYKGWPTMGVEPEFFELFQPVDGRALALRAGSFMRPGEAGVMDVVVGAAAARGTGLKLGDELSITHGATPEGHVHDEFKFKVVGLLEATGTPHDRAIFVSAMSKWLVHADDQRQANAARAGAKEHVEPTPENLTPAEKPVTAIYVRAKRPATIAQLVGVLRNDLGLTAAFPSVEVASLFRIVGRVDQVLLGIALVVALSSGISILLAMYNSMSQRRRQVAILRVLGASPARVFGLVMTEAALVGILGAAAGVVVAIVGAAGVARAVEAQTGVTISPTLDPANVLMVFSGSVLLAAGAGLLPALMAYRTSVVANLRPLG